MTRDFQPTPEQRALIELTDGCHLVQAPPGTGKTWVLTERIMHLLSLDSTATFHILALTFTTKAAETLRSRIAGTLGETRHRVKASTFHAFCLDVLQHYGELVEFAGDTTVYDSDVDRLDVLARAREQEGLHPLDEKDLGLLLTRIGSLKRALTAPDAVLDRDLSVAYAGYNRVLKQFHGCDFDDLLWHAWKLFAEVPRVARHYRRRFRHIMIDEAQDTSRAQYEVLRALCGEEHRRVMLVADSDQFIYGFAGASDRWLKAFTEDFGAAVHSLTANFRCSGSIVDHANRLIANHAGRPPREPMKPANAALGGVFAMAFNTEVDEARGVADWVERLLERGLDARWLHAGEGTAIAPEEICVLGRNRYCLEGVLHELEQREIAFVFSTGERGFLETAVGRLAYQGLRVLQNPADRVTRENILAEWSTPLLDQGVADLPVREFLSRLSDVEGPRAIAVVLLDHLETMDFARLMGSLLDLIDAGGPADDLASSLLKGDARTLRERWEAYRGHTAPEERSIGGLLGELALAGRGATDGPGVRVLTVHAAKGLEFKAVALVGMNEGTLPDYRRLGSDSDIAEEMRVAYVAVTRASRALLLTRPRVKRMPWGAEKPQQESQFIEQMGLVMEQA